MKSWSKGNWTGLAVVMLVGAGGLAAYCHFTSDCLFASTRQSANPQKPNGEKPMITDIQSAVVHADEQTFRKEVLDSEIPVLVDFYADWCRPCQLLGPVLEELALETPDARIVKVNVTDSPQLAGQYGVRSIPHLLVFKNGRIVGRQEGLASKQQLKSLLAE
jgi:thioredoxin 1